MGEKTGQKNKRASETVINFKSGMLSCMLHHFGDFICIKDCDGDDWIVVLKAP